MKKPPMLRGWAVYQIKAKGTEPAVHALCEQREWSQIEKDGAGRFVLVRGGILNEGEAERLARGTSGDPRSSKPVPPWLKKHPS